MKNVLRKISVFVILALYLPFGANAQDNAKAELRYAVNIVYQPLSISSATLNSALTVKDLNEYYQPSWIRTFIGVEITAMNNGMRVVAQSFDDKLTPQQKEIMANADNGSSILIDIKYIPENTLKSNDPKKFNFSFVVNPDQAASFPGGMLAMNNYIEQQAIENLAVSDFDKANLAAVNFTINEEGEVENAYVFESSKNEALDKILLETICNMPKWTPAHFLNGETTRQDYVLTVGNMESCVINLLNVRKE